MVLKFDVPDGVDDCIDCLFRYVNPLQRSRRMIQRDIKKLLKQELDSNGNLPFRLVVEIEYNITCN